jgi:hypothetical protein
MLIKLSVSADQGQDIAGLANLFTESAPWGVATLRGTAFAWRPA